MTARINAILQPEDPIIPYNYVYKLSRVGMGERWRRGECIASVVDLSNRNPSTSETALPFSSDFAFEWGKDEAPMRKRQTLLAKAILYHHLAGGYMFDVREFDSKPKVQKLVKFFKDTFLVDVPFYGCEIPEYVLDTWVEYASDELGF